MTSRLLFPQMKYQPDGLDTIVPSKKKTTTAAAALLPPSLPLQRNTISQQYLNPNSGHSPSHQYQPQQQPQQRQKITTPLRSQQQQQQQPQLPPTLKPVRKPSIPHSPKCVHQDYWDTQTATTTATSPTSSSSTTTSTSYTSISDSNASSSSIRMLGEMGMYRKTKEQWYGEPLVHVSYFVYHMNHNEKDQTELEQLRHENIVLRQQYQWLQQQQQQQQQHDIHYPCHPPYSM